MSACVHLREFIISQGNDEFERITGEIQSEVNSHLGGLDGETTHTHTIWPHHVLYTCMCEPT